MGPDKDQKSSAGSPNRQMLGQGNTEKSVLPSAAQHPADPLSNCVAEESQPPSPGQVSSNLREIYRKDKVLIAHSALAGAASFPISWAVSALAVGKLAAPFANAALGVATSLGVYLAVFYGLSLWRARNEDSERGASLYLGKFVDCVKILGLKEVAEMGLRYAFHSGLMAAGLAAGIASPIAQLISGGTGHLAVPFFANLGKAFSRK